MNLLKWFCDLDLKHMFKKHRSDAGYDLCCAEDIVVPPNMQQVAVKTHLQIKLPDATVGIIAGRSGLALKYGLTVRGGIIDEEYTGEILVILAQPGTEPISFHAGDRIAQLLVLPRYTGPIERVATPEQLGPAERGANGFGSTGGY